MKNAKTLKEVLNILKEKYQNIRICKQIKKHYLVLKIFEVKSTKTYYYIAVFDKKNNIIFYKDTPSVKRIAKKNIPIAIKNFVTHIKEYETNLREKKQLENKNEIIKYHKNKKKLKNKRKKEKKDIGLKYKGKKLDDLVYLWFTMRMILIYADNLKDKFELVKNPTGYLTLATKQDFSDDKFVASSYNKIVALMRKLKIYDNTAENKYLETMFQKIYSKAANALKAKNHNKTTYYIDIYLILYLLQLWQEQVQFKSYKNGDANFDYDLLYKIIPVVYDRYEKEDPKAIENSEFFIEEVFHNIYGSKNYSWFMRLHK